jgi:hypothetical protein
MAARPINQIIIVPTVIGIPTYEVMKIVQDNKPIPIGKLRIPISIQDAFLIIIVVKMDPSKNKPARMRMSMNGT